MLFFTSNTQNDRKFKCIWSSAPSKLSCVEEIQVRVFDSFFFKARCLTPVTSSTEQSKFLAGTVGTKDNVVCLLEYNDDDTTITPTMYSHPEEVWDIASCPADEHLLFTSHSPVSGNPLRRKATLWRKPVVEKEELSSDQHHELAALATLEQEGIKK